MEWENCDNYINRNGESFLFSFTRNSKHNCKKVQYEMLGNENYMIAFGESDLRITDNCD